MPLLAADGVVAYNGFTFGPETETIGVSITPIESADGRTSIGNRYNIRIRSIIAQFANDGITHFNETIFPAIRNVLTRYGRRFTYTGKGLGPIDVGGDAGTTMELAFGPKPKELSWKPIGHLAAEIIWQVEFIITDCTTIAPFGRIFEFAWEATYNIDRNRMTRRDISGIVRIPNKKISETDPRLADSIDEYYERVVPPIPLQFRRENETRNLDRSKSLLTFSFSDTLMESALPGGVLESRVDIEHSNVPYLFVNWNINISASYKMAMHIPTYWASVYFSWLLKDRIFAYSAGIAGGFTNLHSYDPSVAIPLQNGVPVQKLIPIAFTIHEAPHTHEMNFSASFMATCTIPQLMFLGMWRPVPGGNYQVWANAMEIANRPRGYTQEKLKGAYDVVIDLCNAQPEPTTPGARETENEGSLFGDMIDTECPDPENSWIVYYNFVVIMQDNNVIYHTPLSSSPKAPKPTGPGFSLGPQIAAQIEAAEAAGGTGWKPKPDEKPKPSEAPKIQQTSNSTVEIYMIGYALRVCYGIAPPSLVSAGGQQAFMANRGDSEYFVTGIVGNSGLPIYGAKWKQRWVLGGYPNSDLFPIPTPTCPPDDNDFPTPGS